MKAKIGLLAMFLLMVAIAPGLTFFDDLNAYNSITDNSFKANYTTTSAGVGYFEITSDATNGIYLIGYYSVFNPSLYLFPNLSRAGSINLPFTVGYTVLSGSVAPNRTTNGNLDLVFYFLTNATNSTTLATSKGYVAQIKINNDNGANITIGLRRCATSLNNYNSCGVLLKQESFIVDNSLLYNNNTGLIVNNSFSVNVTDSINGDIAVYIADQNRLNYTDKIYSDGNLGFYFSPLTLIAPITVIKIDNLSISGVSGLVSGWSVNSYPQNIDDWIGFSRDGVSTDYSGCGGGTGLKGTFYGINYQPCKYFYESAYPVNEILTPSFVLKYNGDLWSRLLNNVTPISAVGVYAHTLNGNVCYWINSNGVHVPILNHPAFYNGGMATSTLLFADTAPYVRDTNPFLYRGIPFICTQAENVTFEIEFNQGGPNTDIYITIPIGYTFDPDTKIVNYSEIIDATLNDTSGNQVINTPLITEPGITDFGGLSGLVTPLTVLLSAVLIAGAIITRDTHSSQIGLIVIMAGCLILSFYNILPWYITVLITIGAGFFILSQVRTGVFGNAQSA